MSSEAAISFRYALPHEANTIRAIEFEAGQRFVSVDMAGIADAAPIALAIVERKIAAREVIVAVDADSTCAGFVMFEPQPARLYIQELDVLTSHAGRRIGAALIEQVVPIARARRLPHLVLSTFRDVPWNAPYYRRLGFEEIPPEQVDAGLIARRNANLARGHDVSKRVYMRRAVR